MWTICGNYGEEMNQTKKTDLYQNIALYFDIMAGGGMLTRVGLARKVRKKNSKAYHEKFPVYERTIKRLRDTVFQTLHDERAKYFVSADTGIINVPKLWQVGRVPCSRLFKKTESNDKGGYAVDLLIDSSFSQKDGAAG